MNKINVFWILFAIVFISNMVMICCFSEEKEIYKGDTNCYDRYGNLIKDVICEETETHLVILNKPLWYFVIPMVVLIGIFEVLALNSWFEYEDKKWK